MVTKAESQWMAKISEFGCIVCYYRGVKNRRPAAVHHILENGRRKGHLYTIPLCDPGHHKNPPKGHVARHPDKARFEAKYGTEENLLQLTRELVNVL